MLHGPTYAGLSSAKTVWVHTKHYWIHDPATWQKRASGSPIETDITDQETKYLIQLLVKLAECNTANNIVHREKRFIPLCASIGAAIASIVNAGQIGKIKENIAISQDATILQDQQITELARYADSTAARIRLHDNQIYELQYKLLRVE